MVPGAVSMAVIGLSDRLFLEHLIDTSTVGIYAVGNAVGMIIALISDACYKVYTPWMHEQLNDLTPGKRALIVRATYGYALMLMVATALLALVSPYLVAVIADTEYHGASMFVAWIASGYAVRGVYGAVATYSIHEGKTAFVAATVTAAAVINLVANYALIRENGAIGAAQATFVAYAVMALGVWWHANRIHPMPWFSLGFGKST
jgi:O-antigen/teichoic acid export membrane protein